MVNMFELPIISLRTMLRDIALHAALLAGGAELPPVHFWRARCITLVEELEQAMRDAGYPETQAPFMWWIGDIYATSFGAKRDQRLMPT